MLIGEKERGRGEVVFYRGTYHGLQTAEVATIASDANLSLNGNILCLQILKVLNGTIVHIYLE